MGSESDQFYEAMKKIQGFDNVKWNSVYAILTSNDENLNTLNFTSSPSTYHYLADIAFFHKLTPNITDTSDVFYNSDINAKLDGICMDNGAQKTVAGYEAYEKYCNFTKTSVDLAPSIELYRFGNHVYHSVGLTVTRFHIDNGGNCLEYPTDVVMVDLIVLFVLEMMKKWVTI